MKQHECDIVGRFLESGLRCFKIFSCMKDMAKNPYHEKEVLDCFAAVFTVLDPRSFRMVFCSKMKTLFEQVWVCFLLLLLLLLLFFCFFFFFFFFLSSSSSFSSSCSSSLFFFAFCFLLGVVSDFIFSPSKQFLLIAPSYTPYLPHPAPPLTPRDCTAWKAIRENTHIHTRSHTRKAYK